MYSFGIAFRKYVELYSGGLTRTRSATAGDGEQLWRQVQSSASQCSASLPSLHTKHVEPERLMIFAIPARPCLAHIDDNQIVFSNDIQELAFVVCRKRLRETRTKCIHEAA